MDFGVALFYGEFLLRWLLWLLELRGFGMCGGSMYTIAGINLQGDCKFVAISTQPINPTSTLQIAVVLIQDFAA